jgi:hypothetical protein
MNIEVRRFQAVSRGGKHVNERRSLVGQQTGFDSPNQSRGCLANSQQSIDSSATTG